MCIEIIITCFAALVSCFWFPGSYPRLITKVCIHHTIHVQSGQDTITLHSNHSTVQPQSLQDMSAVGSSWAVTRDDFASMPWLTPVVSPLYTSCTSRFRFSPYPWVSPLGTHKQHLCHGHSIWYHSSFPFSFVVSLRKETIYYGDCFGFCIIFHSRKNKIFHGNK